MPNSDAPLSKTQAIKQYLAEHPDVSPMAVAEVHSHHYHVPIR
jgi:hypothetical protein